MLESLELSERLADCSQGELPLGSFEDWFVRNSWNVHQSQDEHLIDVAFEIEELLSAESDARIDSAVLLRRFEELSFLLRASTLSVKIGNIGKSQQITIQWGPSYEVHPQVISMSVSIPERLAL